MTSNGVKIFLAIRKKSRNIRPLTPRKCQSSTGTTKTCFKKFFRSIFVSVLSMMISVIHIPWQTVIYQSRNAHNTLSRLASIRDCTAELIYTYRLFATKANSFLESQHCCLQCGVQGGRGVQGRYTECTYSTISSFVRVLKLCTGITVNNPAKSSPRCT